MKLSIALFALLGGSLSAATLVDDFSGGLGNWTSTRILDNGGATTNTSAFQVNGSGQLEMNTTAYDNIEQYAFIYSGASLGIGEEAQVDMTVPIPGNRNFGLYVGGTAPITAIAGDATRQDYISVYGGTNTNIATRGFDGTSEYGNTQSAGPASDTLFIARTAANTFEVGYYSAAVRTVFETRNPTTPNSADFIGIYADSRALGVVGAIDAFRIIPEPSVGILAAFGLLGLLRRRR